MWSSCYVQSIFGLELVALAVRVVRSARVSLIKAWAPLAQPCGHKFSSSAWPHVSAVHGSGWGIKDGRGGGLWVFLWDLVSPWLLWPTEHSTVMPCKYLGFGLRKLAASISRLLEHSPGALLPFKRPSYPLTTMQETTCSPMVDSPSWAWPPSHPCQRARHENEATPGSSRIKPHDPYQWQRNSSIIQPSPSWHKKSWEEN